MQMPFASVDRFVYLRVSDPAAMSRRAQLQPAIDLSLEPNTLRRHLIFDAARRIFHATSI
jgi:hypothetical protein